MEIEEASARLERVLKAAESEEGLDEICDLGLCDNWSEVRRACAKHIVPKLGISMIVRWTESMMKKKSNWRCVEGYCLALATLASKEEEGDAFLEAALTAIIPIGLRVANAQARDTAISAIAAICSQGIHEDIEKAILELLDDDSAYAKAGGLTALERIGSKRWPNTLSSALTLLADEASTVRQAAATLCQRQVYTNSIVSEILQEVDNEAAAQGILMLLDGILSDEANSALLFDTPVSSLATAALAIQRYYRPTPDKTSFELYRSARQLTATFAIAELCLASKKAPLLALKLIDAGSTRRELASFLLSEACLFARYCAEALGSGGHALVKRWGALHDGAGDDAEAVQRREETVAQAIQRRADTIQERIVENFYKHALAALGRFRRSEDEATLEEALAGIRLIAFISAEDDDRCPMRRRRRTGSNDSLLSPSVSAPDMLGKNNPHLRAVRSSDSVEEALLWCLRDRSWDTLLLENIRHCPAIETTLPEAYAVLCCRADDALSNANFLLQWLQKLSDRYDFSSRASNVAEALLTCLRAAMERAQISLGTDLHSRPTALDAWLDQTLCHAALPAVAVSSAPCVADEFYQALRNCTSLATQISHLLNCHRDQPQLTGRLLRILALNCAFATAAPKKDSFRDLPLHLADICVKATQTDISHRAEFDTLCPKYEEQDEDDDWDNWDEADCDGSQTQQQAASLLLLEALQNDFPLLSSELALPSPPSLPNAIVQSTSTTPCPPIVPASVVLC